MEHVIIVASKDTNQVIVGAMSVSGTPKAKAKTRTRKAKANKLDHWTMLD